MGLAITWLGHATFLLTLPTGQRIVFDPWLGNPRCPEKFSKPESIGKVDVILVTHGHDDHAADVVSLARATSAAVICVAEMDHYLTSRGLRDVRGMNIGGTQSVGELRVTMTMATHSGSHSTADGGLLYLGDASGFILRAPRMPTIYFAGDTGLFGDLKVLGELYRPEIGFLPIGDHYTMGPDTAAIAARWLGLRQVVPMHWGTFPMLHGTPEELESHLDASGISVLKLAPGETAE